MKLPEGWPTEEMVAAGFEVVRQAAPNERAFRIALFRAMLAAAPTPPAQEDFQTIKPEHIADMLDDWSISTDHANDYPFTTHLMQKAAKVIREFQAQEDEPVAEIVVKNTFGYDVYEAELIGAGVNLPKGTKLYTRPADDKLRKAAQEIIFQFDLSCRESACFGSVERIEKLRAELESSSYER